MNADAAHKALFIFLLIKRMPASMMGMVTILKNRNIICEFEGQEWYVSGASRMGDIYLSKGPNKMNYDKRGVYINQITNIRLPDECRNPPVLT